MTRIFLILIGLILLSSCSSPLPEEQSIFVGEWTNEDTTLIITLDGRLEFTHSKGNYSESYSMPIKTITDTQIHTGFLFFSADFEIQGPPIKENDRWYLVVEGHILFKARANGNDSPH